MGSIGNIDDYIDENWHGGNLQGDFFSHPQMTIEQDDFVEENQQKKNVVWNWEHSLIRELMRGKTREQILYKYQDVIKRFDLQIEFEEFLEDYYGVFGYLVVDVSNFDDKFKYKDMPERLRQTNLFAVNSTELQEVITRTLVSQNDGSIDGFFNSDENIHEEVVYIDETTGLPCLENVDDFINYCQEDERIKDVLKIFLNRKWITLEQKNKFQNCDGIGALLVKIIRRSSQLKSNSNGEYSDVINDYDVQDNDLYADVQEEAEEVKINNLKENKLDDIGDVSIQQDLDIKDAKSQLDDVVDIDIDKQMKNYEVKHELGKEDSCGQLDEFDEYDQLDVDNGTQLKNTDIDYYDNSEFVVEDLKDMQDDNFDYSDLSEADVDIYEMLEEESDKNELDIDEQQQEYEVSNKYDWTW